MSKTVDRQETYEAVLRCVEYNTGGAMLPGQSVNGLKTTLCANARHESDQVEKAIDAAVENGDLIRWPGVPFRDAVRLTRTEEEDLVELLDAVSEQMDQLRETARIAGQALKMERDDE